MNQPLVFAHRGSSHALPEHTLPAYLRAIDEGADGLECDVRLTNDGHLVCLHDRRLGRVSDGRGAVSEHTLAELDALDFGRGHPRPSADLILEPGDRVVTLEDEFPNHYYHPLFLGGRGVEFVETPWQCFYDAITPSTRLVALSMLVLVIKMSGGCSCTSHRLVISSPSAEGNRYRASGSEWPRAASCVRCIWQTALKSFLSFRSRRLYSSGSGVGSR